MSIQAIAWVLENSVSEGYDRLVLLAIANHCDARGFNAYPAIDRIAIEARMHRRTVFRSIQSLCELGELEVVSRGGGRSRANQYRLPMKQSLSATLWDPETMVEGPLNGGAQSAKRSQAATPTVINQKQPSRARAREDRPTTDPEGSSGSGRVDPPEWHGEQTLPDPAKRDENLEKVRAIRKGLRVVPSKESKPNTHSEEAS